MTAQEHWAFFFRYLTDKDKRRSINEILEYEEGIAMAGNVLSKISRDEVERARLATEYKNALDIQSKLVYAKRQGIQEGILQTARNLKSIGLSVEQIAATTGLSLEEIGSL